MRISFWRKTPGSADKFLPLLYPSPATLLDYLEPEALVFQSEPIKIKERLRSTAWQWGEDLKDYLRRESCARAWTPFPETISMSKSSWSTGIACTWTPLSGAATIRLFPP